MIRLYFKALFLFWTFAIIYYIIKTLCCKCDPVTESGSFCGVHQTDLHWGQNQRWHPKHYELHNRWWKESKIIRVLSNTTWHSFHHTMFCTNSLHSTWCINNNVWERLYVIHLLAVYFYCLHDLAVNIHTKILDKPQGTTNIKFWYTENTCIVFHLILLSSGTITQPVKWSWRSMLKITRPYKYCFKPSAWSDGHRPHTVNITCCGVTGTARMLHALTHSSISRQVREQM